MQFLLKLNDYYYQTYKMVKLCRACGEEMQDQYKDTCRVCRADAGKTEMVVKRLRKPIFTKAEQKILIQKKIKQGLSYAEAKQELGFENIISNSKINKLNQDKEEEDSKKDPKHEFNKAFAEMCRGDKQ